MASGRQVAHENLQRFTAWIASKTDEDYRALASRGVLSRKEIARECGFAKSPSTKILASRWHFENWKKHFAAKECCRSR